MANLIAQELCASDDEGDSFMKAKAAHQDDSRRKPPEAKH